MSPGNDNDSVVLKRGPKPKYSLEQRKQKKNELIKRWSKKNSFFINIRINVKKDQAIVDKLKSVESIPDYVRALILRDIKKHR